MTPSLAAAGGVLLAYLAAVAAEAGGGALLVLGWHTRVTALAIAGFSLVAAFDARRRQVATQSP